MKTETESSTNSPTATLAPTKSQRDPVGLQATSTPSHLTGDGVFMAHPWEARPG